MKYPTHLATFYGDDMIKISRLKKRKLWEVRALGDNWHIHCGKYLIPTLWRCLTWKKPKLHK